MIDVLFVVCAGIVALGMQTTSLAFVISPAYKPDLMLVLVVWAGLRLPFVGGVVCAFVVGVVVDLLSGSPPGLFGLVYSLVFVVCRHLGGIVRLDGFAGRAILVLCAALWAGIAVLLARLFRGPVGFGWHVVAWITTKSIITAVAAVVLFPCIDWAWLAFSRLLGDRRVASRPTDYV